jgi:predicted AAA+ superfamily ATPase
MSDEYLEQYNNAYTKAYQYILNNKNIIICGPAKSGKTYLQMQIKGILKQNNYHVFYGVEDYISFHSVNGRTQNIDNFWIEEQNIEKIGKLIEDFNYIEMPLSHH